MTAEQAFDLIAEAGWEICEQGRIGGFFSAVCFKHHLDGETDLGRAHYDIHWNGACIPVRECIRLNGKYIYQTRRS